MASPSSAPTEPDGEETSFPAENKELILPTTKTGAVVPSSNAANSLFPATAVDDDDEEATPTPPESSSLSSENGTMTLATTEEESLSVLLRGRTDGGGEAGKRSDLLQDLDLIFSANNTSSFGSCEEGLQLLAL